VLAAVYFGCGVFGLSLALVNKSASAVWPPSGLALAALLLGGTELWPGVFAGAFLVNFLTQGSMATSLAIATGNTLEAVVAAKLVVRFANGALAFDRTKNIFKFVLFAAMLSTLISATIGVITLCVGGLATWHEFWSIWLTWWLGDMVSDVIIAPLLVLWATKPFPRINWRSAFDAAVLSLLLIWVGRLVFLRKAPFSGDSYSLEYLTIPPLLWAAFRFQERGAVTASFLLSGIAIWGTRHQLGPFVRSDPHASLLLLQSFMGTVTMSGLVLASIVSERARGEQRLLVQDAISRVLAEAASLKEATPKIFQTLCEKAQCDVGSIWDVNQAASELTCVEFWHVPDKNFPQFEAMTREIKFKPGMGLRGRVWSSGKPVWIRDVVEDNNFPRAAAAAADDLHGALCFPLKLGDELVSIIECFSREFREPDEDFLQMLDTIGSQIGQFIERKRAEEAQARLAAIVESSGDAIIGETLTGVITSWNKGAERIYGYTAAEAISQPIWMLVPPDQEIMEREVLERVRSGEHIDHYETQRVRKGGSALDVSLSISPVRDSSGQIIGASKIARDITQRKRMEAQAEEQTAQLRHQAEELRRSNENLERSNTELRQFAYIASHDLQTPLRNICGFVQLVKLNYADRLDEQASDWIGRAVQSTVRMQALIRDVLAYSRVDSEAEPFRRIPFREVFNDAVVTLEAPIRDVHGQVTCDRLPMVMGDRSQLEQLMQNLLGNGLKYHGNDAPRVHVSAQRAGNEWVFCVRDNGIGIAPKYHERIFEIFQRLHSQREHPGTGIGLAVCRRVVHRHGGRIWVESEPGHGSTFYFTIPERMVEQ
jgi:PAS domain S-box-containing protein